MPTLRVLNAGGDRQVRWDVDQLMRGDPEAKAAVREAELIFQRERARGAVALSVQPGAPAERLEAFDAQVEDTILVPPMAGG